MLYLSGVQPVVTSGGTLKMTKTISWKIFSETYAFLGNSLLAPMSQTASIGLSVDFWHEFPNFGDATVLRALSDCVQFAKDSSQCTSEGVNMVQKVSVEYTRLFIGPPSPAAPPWETMYHSGTNIGFGEATFQMRSLLREAGLEVKNVNNQYEDHMGIELLYLSELCRRRAELDADGKAHSVDDCESDGRIFVFIESHPLFWVDAFYSRVADAFPSGYYANLIALEAALLRCHTKMLVA